MDKNIINNVLDEENLKTNLVFSAFFITFYESFTSVIRDRLSEFFFDEIKIVDCEPIFITGKKYKEEVSDRIVDDKGNKDITKSSFLWFVDRGCFTNEDYIDFLSIKQTRNKYVHQLNQILYDGVHENEIKQLEKLKVMYHKVDRWWINEVEIPTAGHEIKPGYDAENVVSSNLLMLDIMLDIGLLGLSEQYKTIIEQLKKKMQSD